LQDYLIKLEHPIKHVFSDDVIAKALKDIGLYEKEIESVKVELASQSEFRINQLFHLFD